LSLSEIVQISLTPPNLKFPKSFEITGISFYFNKNGILRQCNIERFRQAFDDSDSYLTEKMLTKMLTNIKR